MLGLTSLSGAPIATSFFNPNVLINVTGNALSIGVGTPILSTDVTASPSGSQVSLGAGTVTVTGTAVVNPLDHKHH